MKKDQPSKQKLDSNSVVKSGFACTDAQKVKKEIKKDVNRGQGAMTSREAGSMRD